MKLENTPQLTLVVDEHETLTLEIVSDQSADKPVMFDFPLSDFGKLKIAERAAVGENTLEFTVKDQKISMGFEEFSTAREIAKEIRRSQALLRKKISLKALTYTALLGFFCGLLFVYATYVVVFEPALTPEMRAQLIQMEQQRNEAAKATEPVDQRVTPKQSPTRQSNATTWEP